MGCHLAKISTKSDTKATTNYLYEPDININETCSNSNSGLESHDNIFEDNNIIYENFNSRINEESNNYAVLQGEDFRDDLVSFAKEHPKVRNVQFMKKNGNNNWIPTDVDLEKLKNLPNLTSIDITGCSAITRIGLMQVSVDLGRIHTLILSECDRLTDNFLSNIIVFRNLLRLDLRGCFRITNYGIDCLSVMKTLRHLDISLYAVPGYKIQYLPSERITDEALESLSRLQKLQRLEIESCLGITDTGFNQIKSLQNLTYLNVNRTSISGNSLHNIAALSRIRTLKMASCKVINGAPLAAMSELNCLDMSGGYMINDNMKFLKYILNLTYLNISCSISLTDIGIAEIQNLPSLSWINASGCVKLTDLALVEFAKIGHLQRLNINGCNKMTIDGILKLKKLRRFKYLEIGMKLADNERLKELKLIESLSDLTIHKNDMIDRCENNNTINIPGIQIIIL